MRYNGEAIRCAYRISFLELPDNLGRQRQCDPKDFDNPCAQAYKLGMREASNHG